MPMQAVGACRSCIIHAFTWFSIYKVTGFFLSYKLHFGFIGRSTQNLAKHQSLRLIQQSQISSSIMFEGMSSNLQIVQP